MTCGKHVQLQHVYEGLRQSRLQAHCIMRKRPDAFLTLQIGI